MKAMLGQKIIMSRIFDETGLQIPVTLIKIDKNIVTQIKTKEKDGYQAIQIGAGLKKKLNRPEKGHLNKIKTKLRHLFEIKSDKEYKVGDEIDLEKFDEGEIVNVTAVSKGKGFSGTVKRHNFHLGPKSHGSNNYRQPGSIGSAYPQRVIKGKKMPGHLGAQKTTVKNLKIIKVDKGNRQVLIRGAVPGNKYSPVLLWTIKEEKNES